MLKRLTWAVGHSWGARGDGVLLGLVHGGGGVWDAGGRGWVGWLRGLGGGGLVGLLSRGWVSWLWCLVGGGGSWVGWLWCLVGRGGLDRVTSLWVGNVSSLSGGHNGEDGDHGGSHFDGLGGII